MTCVGRVFSGDWWLGEVSEVKHGNHISRAPQAH